MMQLPLSRGRVALIDDEDYDALSGSRWLYSGGMAVRSVRADGRRKFEYLHRVVMKDPAWMEVIFLNGDHLDCRKANLKAVTRHEAGWHRRVRHDSSSGAKGLRYNPASGRWYAGITRFGAFYHLGTFATKESAQAAYKEAAQRLARTGQHTDTDERQRPPR